MSEFAELFEFLAHDREDIRKAAAEGVAAQSVEGANGPLLEFIRSGDAGAAAMRQLLGLATTRNLPLIGHVLTALINVAADPMAAEVLVTKCDVVPKAVRLLEALERVEAGTAAGQVLPQRLWALKEMGLMLLNNLTANHIMAVEALLQADDDEMLGFSFSKLHTLFQKQTLPDASELGEEARKQDPRDLRPWYIKICLNATRVQRGRAIVADDDEWFKTITELLDPAPEQFESAQSQLEYFVNEPLRLLAAEVLHNIASSKELHGRLVEGKVVQRMFTRLDGKRERTAAGQMVLAETLAVMMTSEEGMQALEDTNAKKAVMAAMESLHEDTRAFLEENLVPFLDDIKDVYVLPGADGEQGLSTKPPTKEQLEAAAAAQQRLAEVKAKEEERRAAAIAAVMKRKETGEQSPVDADDADAGMAEAMAEALD